MAKKHKRQLWIEYVFRIYFHIQVKDLSSQHSFHSAKYKVSKVLTLVCVIETDENIIQ